MAIRGVVLSTDEWESNIGDQLRRARLTAGFDQAQLAERADISIGALRNLERGKGSTLKTLVRVARALGRDDWLGSLQPAVSVSPLEVFRSGKRERSRVYRARRATNSEDS
ncbi:MAG TPA: helix-turn-helix transcriptional regulator [Galbitalea sp.]|jgi:transcriptional regulator with XRE-family HTH domain|nr:helix-turn-helix transcriptional regulator [Galbitalea sp.]